MAFQISPGLNITEKDLTLGVAAVSTSKGAFAGAFAWGPVEERTLVGSEADLATIFGTPTDFTSTYFLTAASFLAYSNALEIVRVLGKHDVTVSQTVGVFSPDTNDVSWSTNEFAGYVDASEVVRVNGIVTTGVTLAVTPAGNATLTKDVGTFADGDVISITFKRYAALNATSEGVGVLIKNINDYEVKAPTNTNKFIAKYAGVKGNGVKVYLLDSAAYAALDASPVDAEAVAVKGAFDSAPLADELHVAVVDGGIVVEKFSYLSEIVGTKSSDGTNIYFKDVINNQSDYVWVGGDLAAVDASATPFTLSGGDSDLGSETNYALDLTDGLALFADAETNDSSLLFVGPANATEVRWAVDNVAEIRKDLVVFFSPRREDVVGVPGRELTNILGFRTTSLNNLSSSYAFMDSNWKYMYDRYNDKYRWVPLNGDIAGLAARTDNVADPWFSIAGYNRGQIKNVVKLAWNPNKAQRDELYKNQVNPVISQIGGGTILFGDKTLLSRPSAFDRINVRRLFIVLEKAVANSAKFLLFEFNDQFTRATFRNLVEPFLRDVQGRRGIFDFRVICDESNNTPEVIDRNEFIGDIYVKPARSINYIQLNFVAVRTGVSFEEITGA